MEVEIAKSEKYQNNNDNEDDEAWEVMVMMMDGVIISTNDSVECSPFNLFVPVRRYINYTEKKNNNNNNNFFIKCK